MYTSFFIAKNNMKKKKSDVAVIILLIALATLLLYVSVSSLSNSERVVDNAANACNTAAHTYYTSEEGSKYVVDVWEKMDYVTEYEVSPVLHIPDAKYYGADRKNERNFVFIMSSMEEERAINKMNVYEMGQIKENSIILPYYISVTEGYEIGDIFYMVIGEKEYEFEIAGFSEDPVFANTLNITIYRVYISDEYMKEIGKNKGFSYIECRVLFEDGTDIDTYLNDFVEKMEGRDKDSIIGLLGDTMKNGVTMMTSILMGMMLIFSVLLVFIAIIIMRFSVRNFIDDNLKNIGILQASGYTSKELRKATIMEMGIIGIVGTIIGIIFSSFSQNAIGGIQAAMMGLRYNAGFDIIYGFTAIAIIMFIVLFMTYISSRTYKNINVLDALRGGIHTHNFKKNSIPLHKTKLPLNIAVGVKYIFGAKLKNIGIMLIISILSFTSCIGFSMYQNFALDKEFMLKLVGAELGTAIAANEESDKMGAVIETWDEVEKVLYYKSIDVNASNEEKSKTVACDTWNNPDYVENITIIEGSVPKYNNEVAISTVLRDYFEVELGDVIYLQGDGEKKPFIVSGIHQMINNMGQKMMLSYEGVKYLNSLEEVESVQLYVYAADGYDFDDLDSLISQHFKGAQIIESEKMMDESMGTLIMAMELICSIFVIITVVVVFLVVFLVIRSKVVSDKKNNGIYKAIGYTTKDLMVQTTMTNLPVIFVGAVLGAVLSIFGAEPLCVACLSFCAIERCDLTNSPVYLVLTVALITFVAWMVAMLVSSRIRKIEPVKMLTEE